MVPESQRRQRIIALDIMRGFFLVVIIVNHLYFFPSIFELITGRGELWVSAAEGFFLISGTLVGYIYARKMSQDAKAAVKKILKRVIVLWFWAIVITTITLIWAHNVHDAYLKPGFWWQPPLGEYLYKVVTLQYNYGWADFLQYYALFMLFAPLALWLCLKHKAWLVLLISFAIWLFRGDNFIMAWQLLFMSGIVIGYYLPRIEGWWNTRETRTRKRLAWTIGTAAIVTLAVSVIIAHGPGFIANMPGAFSEQLAGAQHTLSEWRTTMYPYFAKWTLAPLRLVLVALWFAALYLFVRTHEKQVDKYSLGVFRTLGECSLLVYGVHALVVYGAHIYIAAPKDETGFIFNTILTAIILAGFYFGIRYRLVIKQALLAPITSVKNWYTKTHA